jgi:adenine-specific DNA-methyltransferase
MIQYLGSKEKLLPYILNLLPPPEAGPVCDLFSGSARVSTAMRQSGYTVHANDYLQFASILARAALTPVSDEAFYENLYEMFRECLKNNDGDAYVQHWFTHRYAIQSWFFTVRNASNIACIRERIYNDDPHLLATLIRGADKISSTCGLYMAYLKDYPKKAFRPLTLQPWYVEGPEGVAHQMDAADFLRIAPHFSAIYIDPPYNSHSYAGNYHLWETLVRWDNPNTYGLAMKRADTRTNKSPFNSKKASWEALVEVFDLAAARADHLIVSFNNEGFHSFDSIQNVLSNYGAVTTYQIPHRRHVGHRIGQYNPSGVRVAAPSHATTQECLFHVTID